MDHGGEPAVVHLLSNLELLLTNYLHGERQGDDAVNRLCASMRGVTALCTTSSGRCVVLRAAPWLFGTSTPAKDESTSCNDDAREAPSLLIRFAASWRTRSCAVETRTTFMEMCATAVYTLPSRHPAADEVEFTTTVARWAPCVHSHVFDLKDHPDIFLRSTVWHWVDVCIEAEGRRCKSKGTPTCQVALVAPVCAAFLSSSRALEEAEVSVREAMIQAASTAIRWAPFVGVEPFLKGLNRLVSAGVYGAGVGKRAQNVESL